MAKRRRTPPPRQAARESGVATAEWLVAIAVAFVSFAGGSCPGTTGRT